MANHHAMDIWGGYIVNPTVNGRPAVHPANLELYEHLTARDAQTLTNRAVRRVVQYQPLLSTEAKRSVVEHRLDTETLIRQKALHFLQDNECFQVLLNRINAEEEGNARLAANREEPRLPIMIIHCQWKMVVPPQGVHINLNDPPVIPLENPLPVPVVTEVRIRDFQKLKPLTFQGGLDPVKANEWLESIEKIAQVMQCEAREKVVLALYNLTGEAQRWRTLVRRAEPQMGWERFYDLFNQKYIPPSIKDSKSMEFQNLTQKPGMIVAQYEAEFTTLAHYAPHLILDENMKARRFEGGLNPDLRKLIKSLKLPTYAEVLDRSLMLEDESAKTDHMSEPKKRKNEDQNTSNGHTK
ncbi:hypothetical protein RHSIM_Rhsim06G0100400 [Rhododendron simsii]|uniref:Retrotransposon gag domain-containing protein n=1 Tax=Rhododendron simsii TaxID=118357 RepID=A0A834GST2_RHOSS|nr:hypothetical protein RHSIM_Rhsim06G0100400 [Rhododendron simsii]